MNALIVATNKQISSTLASALKRTGADNIVLASDTVAAKRLIGERSFSVTVIYAETGSGHSTDLARVIASHGNGGVILIEAARYSDEIAQQLEDVGVIVLSKPLSYTDLFRAVKMVRATNNRIARLVEEKRDLLKKIDDMRIINRAKLILMQNMGFTEEQAHHHIEKRAMDMRKTRAEVAMDILKTYEV